MTPTPEALGELENLAIFAQASKGLVPAWVPRPMLPHEIRAGVNFAAIDRSMRTGYARAADILRQLRRDLASSLAAAIGGEQDPRKIKGLVAQWAEHPPKAVLVAKARAKSDMHIALLACAARAGEQLRAEAASQGVAPGRVVRAADPTPPKPLDPLVADLRRAGIAGLVDPVELLDDAALPVESLMSKAVNAAVLASQRSTADEVVKAVDDVRDAESLDLARQGVHVATGEGRVAATEELPEPQEIYASELLDERTCDPCAAVDGTNYDTLADGEADYPGQAAYVDCEGGARCRGTLVFVWA